MSLKTSTTDLSAKIAAELKIVDGAIDDKTAYRAVLPEDLSAEQVEQVRAFDKSYTPAFTHATQQVVFDAMKADDELTSMSANTDMLGGDSFSTTINRVRKFPVPNEAGKTVEVFGSASTAHKTMAGKNAGELKKVLTAGKEQFAALATK